MSLVEKLDDASLAAFNEAASKPFSEQCQFFLNAYWDEFGDQAECIYSVAWDWMKKADMRFHGVQYVHLYNEGFDLDFDMGLFFFEQLCKYFNEDPEGKKYAQQYPKSVPKMMTSIVRKKELRERVDVNFDGRVSMLEYLLYQYDASPKTLMDRSKGKQGELPEEVLAAMAALREVNLRVQEYEKEKARLEDESENGATNIKRMKAKNELAQLNSSPLWERLNEALIHAEAKVRIAARKYGIKLSGKADDNDGEAPRTNGTMWWLQRELEEKKKRYGR